jgi:hypothetical protein
VDTVDRQRDAPCKERYHDAEAAHQSEADHRLRQDLARRVGVVVMTVTMVVVIMAMSAQRVFHRPSID